MTRQGSAAEANISASFRMSPIVAMVFGGIAYFAVLCHSIAVTNAVTVILTFTTASQ